MEQPPLLFLLKLGCRDTKRPPNPGHARFLFWVAGSGGSFSIPCSVSPPPASVPPAVTVSAHGL